MGNDNNTNTSNIEVKVPYRFVPLSKFVYIPDWSYRVSQDIPFEDEISGSISYELENDTDLCVGSSNKDHVVSWEKEPCNDRHVIPGSSIKGMLRNVLEIASFGKMNQVNDVLHSFRDLTNTKTDYLQEYNKYAIKTGFLVKEDEKWRIYYCECAKLPNKILRAKEVDIINDTSQKVMDKYKKLPLRNNLFSAKVENSNNGKNVTAISQKQKLEKNGYAVFTGYRIVSSSSKKELLDYSYFFYEVREEPIDVSDNVVNQFFISQNEELINYLKKNNLSHPNNKDLRIGFPVWAFHIKDREKEIKQLGTCKMSRMLCDKSIKDIIKSISTEHFNTHNYDLSEIMLGTIREDHGYLSLKGRVLFSDVIAKDKYDESVSSSIILGEPHSSFSSTYLEWYSDSQYPEYKTSCKIAGRKRYQIQTKFHTQTISNGNENVGVKLTTVAPKSVFKGKIVFHNLKKVELGALLWCMQFGSDANTTCRHSLGLGKPYGAGSVRLKINEIDFPSYSSTELKDQDTSTIIQNCINEFEENMEKVYSAAFQNASWRESPQIKLLQLYAQPTDMYINDTPYNVLTEFSKIKSNIIKPSFGKEQDAVERKEKTTPKTLKISDPLAERYKNIFENKGGVDELDSSISLTSHESTYSFEEAENFYKFKNKCKDYFATKTPSDKPKLTLSNELKQRSEYSELRNLLKPIVTVLEQANENSGEHKSLLKEMLDFKEESIKIEMTNKKKKPIKTIIQCFDPDEKIKELKEKFKITDQ